MAVAQIQSLSWELSYVMGEAKKKRKKRKEVSCLSRGNFDEIFFFLFIASPATYGGSQARG